MVDISVIIVNFNIKDIVDACIESIYKSNNTNLNIEIFFVDNHSIDGSPDFIRQKYPDVKVIENDSNLGFSKANNIAIKEAKGKYILILNPDTVLAEYTFDKIIKYLEKNPNVGAVSSKLIRANGELDSACRRSFPTFRVALPRLFGLSKLFPKSKLFGKYNLTYLDENEINEVDAICGAFMFMPKNVVDEVGFFDETFFMYGEDLDYCFRINQKGYKIVYYPEVTTVHLKGESTRKTNLSYVNNFYGAMAIFVRKNLKGKGFLLLSILQIGIWLRSLLSYFKRIFFYLLLPIADAILLLIISLFAVENRFHIFPTPKYFFILGVYISIWVTIMALFGLYTRKYSRSLIRTFNAIVAGFFINSSITYFFKDYAFSREVVLLTTVLTLIIFLVLRGLFALRHFFVSKNITLKKINLLIVGDKKLNQNIEDKFTAKYNILYFFQLSKRGTLGDLIEIIRINGINEIVFSSDKFSNIEILGLMRTFIGQNVNFKILPTGKDLILSKLHSGINDVALIEIEYNINNKLNIFLKRLFDVVLSFFLLLFVYPFVVMRDNLFKRVLSKHAAKLLLLPKVFTGKYSFVGSPVWYEHNSKINLGKPGLAGIAQLNYHLNITKEELDNYNIYYAKNQSLVLDLEILLKTLFSFFRK